MKLIVALAVLIACLIVQRMALHKAAFGRSLFILSMGFLTSIVVGISPYPPARFLSQALFWMTWGFILFMTAISLVRLRRRRS
ncbi:MAG: hypothetical protein QJR06_04180 [Alicyclobacillaceae bacterium]|nr:hypothetical protein [Alicyclobacillaceae bacterium]